MVDAPNLLKRFVVAFLVLVGLIDTGHFRNGDLLGGAACVGEHAILCRVATVTSRHASAGVAAMQTRIKSLSGVDRSEICTATRLYFLEVVKARAVTALCKSGTEREREPRPLRRRRRRTLTRRSPRAAYDNMIRLGM